MLKNKYCQYYKTGKLLGCKKHTNNFGSKK